MTKHIFMLTTVTFALVCGGIPARAQEDSDDPVMMQHWEEVQQNQGDEEDTPMTGHGMMRYIVSGNAWRRMAGWARGGGSTA